MKNLMMAALLLFVLNISFVVANDSLPLQKIEYQKYPQYMVYDGVIEAVKQATISAQTSGRIVELNFDVDDFVPQNSVIMRLRDNQQQSQLSAADAALQEAKALHTKSKAEHKRVLELQGKKLVAISVLDQAIAELNASEQRLKATRAKRQQAKEQLDYTVIKAPFSGIVVARHIEQGEMANVGQPLMTGFAIDDMRVSASVPQNYIEQIRESSTAKVIFEQTKTKTFMSQKVTFYPYADPITHNFKVRVGLPKGMKGIYPGMMVKVAFTTGSLQALVVDPKAIVYRGEVTAVYVVSGDTISYRQIRLGRHLDDGQIEVLAGLYEHEQVSLTPLQAGIALKRRTQSGE